MTDTDSITQVYHPRIASATPKAMPMTISSLGPRSNRVHDGIGHLDYGP